MPRKLIIAFLIAAPLGVALGFAATTFLAPRAAAEVFDLFLAFIVLGAVGAVLASRPSRGRGPIQKTTSLTAGVAA